MSNASTYVDRRFFIVIASDMLELNSASLRVQILHPIDDRDKLGTRYCTGGYIYQVEDRRQGHLLSGPTYPESFNWFDGQGIPDAFNQHPLEIPESNDGEALIIGIGVCNLNAKTMTDFCVWQIETTDESVVFSTEHRYGPYVLRLERTVSLYGRTVRSDTTIRNHGDMKIPLNWFPHPFYPHPVENELCKVNLDVTIPENDGYELGSNGFITRKSWPWSDGHYQVVDHHAASPLVVLQKHPVVGLVTAEFSYAPGVFPIWGNKNTFSFEPYLERTVAPGHSYSWSIDYDF